MTKLLFPAACLALAAGFCRAAGIADPASVNCEEKGGKVEVYDGKNGQVGFCRLGDQAAIAEWTLFRGGKTKAIQAFKKHASPKGGAKEYCAQAGGRIVEFTRGKTRLSACKFPDKSAMDIDTLFEGPARRPKLAELLK